MSNLMSVKISGYYNPNSAEVPGFIKVRYYTDGLHRVVLIPLKGPMENPEANTDNIEVWGNKGKRLDRDNTTDGIVETVLKNLGTLVERFERKTRIRFIGTSPSSFSFFAGNTLFGFGMGTVNFTDTVNLDSRTISAYDESPAKTRERLIILRFSSYALKVEDDYLGIFRIHQQKGDPFGKWSYCIPFYASAQRVDLMDYGKMPDEANVVRGLSVNDSMEVAPGSPELRRGLKSLEDYLNGRWSEYFTGFKTVEVRTDSRDRLPGWMKDMMREGNDSVYTSSFTPLSEAEVKCGRTIRSENIEFHLSNHQ